MRVALLSDGLPRPRGVEIVGGGGPVDVAVARGRAGMQALARAEADRKVLVLDDLEDAPHAVDEPVTLVAGGRWLADALGGRSVPVLRPHRPEVLEDDPPPLTRGPLVDQVVWHRERSVAEVLDHFASGQTVVVPDTPAMREVVTDGFDGVVLHRFSRRRAARVVRELDADRVRLHLLRHNARLTALGWPGEAQQATVLEAIVRRAAAQPPPPPPGDLPRPRRTLFR